MSDDNVESEVAEPTAELAVEWMLEYLQSHRDLPQWKAVRGIKEHIGDEFLYINGNGNPAIDKDVLKEFKKRTADTVVWSKSGLYWRLREPGDDPNKRQVP